VRFFQTRDVLRLKTTQKGKWKVSEKFIGIALVAVVSAIACSPAYADQPLETETARLPAQGHGSAHLGFEYATSSAGHTTLVPLILKYGITDRLQLTIEPVLFTSVNPKGAASTKGFGNTEILLTYLVAQESASMPALALGGEIKIPTTKKPDLGSGATDYRAFGIASKKFGNLDLTGVVGYTFVGSPKGSRLSNLFDYAIAAEYAVSEKTSIVAEVYGETATGSTIIGGIATETGTIVTGMIGANYKPSSAISLSFGVNYNSENEVVFKPGVTFRF
jgi:Putative MetA-pathway of phenol degradation